MNQPLAHLYFLAALEALHNCKYDVAQLLTYVEEMKQVSHDEFSYETDLNIYHSFRAYLQAMMRAF